MKIAAAVPWRAIAVCGSLGLAVGCSGNGGAAPATSTQSVSATPPATSLPDPLEVVLPAVEGEMAKAWLRGDGAGAVQMVVASERLVAGGAPACPDAISVLDDAGSPEVLLVAAAGTPDEPTQDVLVGLHAVLGAALRACRDPINFAAPINELRWQTTIAARRLDEIGAR